MRTEYIIDTQREDIGWEETSLVWMYNVIKYIFNLNDNKLEPVRYKGLRS